MSPAATRKTTVKKTTTPAKKTATPEPMSAKPACIRIGTITGLKPEMEKKYRELHAAVWPGVLDRIYKSNIRNYSISLKKVGGKLYLFSYFEYVGKNWQKDMDAIAADPETSKKWWKETDPCQIPFEAAAEKQQIWDDMEEVFHSDGAVDVVPSGPVRRVETITGLKFDKEAYYRILHAAVWPNVLKAIRNANIRNYSIYLKDIGGKLYLYSYFEYVGKDFDADMQGIGKDPVTRRWWAQTDPCQIPLPAAKAKKEIWDACEEVFYTE